MGIKWSLDSYQRKPCRFQIYMTILLKPSVQSRVMKLFVWRQFGRMTTSISVAVRGFASSGHGCEWVLNTTSGLCNLLVSTCCRFLHEPITLPKQLMVRLSVWLCFGDKRFGLCNLAYPIRSLEDWVVINCSLLDHVESELKPERWVIEFWSLFKILQLNPLHNFNPLIDI